MSSCLGCWDENGRVLGCTNPQATCECDWCYDQRYWDSHPVEAAERDYEELEAEAMRAEEGGHEDWRERAAEAASAYRFWQELVEDQASQGRAERAVGEP